MSARELADEKANSYQDMQDAAAQGARRTAEMARHRIRVLTDEQRRRDPKGLRR